jgi:hypothetical protein
MEVGKRCWVKQKDGLIEKENLMYASASYIEIVADSSGQLLRDHNSPSSERGE